MVMKSLFWLSVDSICLQEEKEQLIEYRSTVASLVGRAKTVVQLRPRGAENTLGSTTLIKAICDYRQIEVWDALCSTNGVVVWINGQNSGRAQLYMVAAWRWPHHPIVSTLTFNHFLSALHPLSKPCVLLFSRNAVVVFLVFILMRTYTWQTQPALNWFHNVVFHYISFCKVVWIGLQKWTFFYSPPLCDTSYVVGYKKR